MDEQADKDQLAIQVSQELLELRKQNLSDELLPLEEQVVLVVLRLHSEQVVLVVLDELLGRRREQCLTNSILFSQRIIL